MKRFVVAALMLLAPIASHAQFAFNRQSCVVNLINACVQVDATFNPTSTGTFVSMRLHVNQEPANPTDQSAIALTYISFDSGPGSGQGDTYQDIPWLAMYGNVQGTSNIQPEDIPWTFAADGLFAVSLPKYLIGCNPTYAVAAFQICNSQFGYGAFELNWFAPTIYDASLLNRVRIWGDGRNAAGQRIGLGCAMETLGVAQGDGPYSPSTQPEGKNYCNTTDEFESLAVGPRTVLTTPEPSTYALMGAGLLAIGYVRRRRNRVA